jgi:hypothetical protein
VFTPVVPREKSNHPVTSTSSCHVERSETSLVFPGHIDGLTEILRCAQNDKRKWAFDRVTLDLVWRLTVESW